MKYLLDTCVLSELKKKQPQTSVVSWLTAQVENSLYLSVITIGEIEKGIAKLPAGSDKKETLEKWLENELIPRFSERLLSVDTDVVRSWCGILGENENKGIVVPAVDALIGATAIVNGCTLVTRNVKDFENIPCNVKDIWN